MKMISEKLKMLAQEVATDFRLGMEAQAGENLVALIDMLPQMFESGSGVDAMRLNALLTAMFAAQSRRDYIYLADLLQYELADLFNRIPPQYSAEQ